MTKEDAIALINQMYADLLGNKGKRRNPYRYWSIPRNWKGTRYRIGWTPWKIQCRGKTGFFAIKYRETKEKLKLVKAVRFGSRKKTKARALEWHNKYYDGKVKE